MQNFSYTGERFADIQMLRYRLAGFSFLTARQKAYIYYLSEATLAGRDITFHQFGVFNIDIRRTLEAIYLDYQGDRTTTDFQEMEIYLKRVWFSSGIHHHYAQDKFVPGFSEAFFREAANGIEEGKLHIPDGQTKEEYINKITDVIFNKDIMPKRVCLDNGVDLLANSSVSYYDGVSQKEAEDFYNEKNKTVEGDEKPSFGLNSTLVKQADGALKETVWCKNGQYSKQIERIIYWLEKAMTVTENEKQTEVIRLLIEYYTTGELSVFDEYNIKWLAAKEGTVDFVNGFIEVYSDPLGIKGSWEGIVEYIDHEATRRTKLVCDNAQWFEDHSPIDPRFRKKEVRGVTANVVCAAMLGGDEYPASAIGINLPNADWIRSRYGSKSVTIGNLTEAYNQAAKGNGFRQEFINDDSVIALVDKYADATDDLHTDLHECLGHGSGQLMPGVDAGALKAYGSTIEEARADLFGLYYMADPKLVELGLLPDGDAYKAQYYTYMLNGLLTQMVRIKPGAQIEEAHMRNRAIIARWAMSHSSGNVELKKVGGKTYLYIHDYEALRSCFATLLAEVQRIKSEGDYEAACSMVEDYGVKLDAALHEEVLSRYSALNIAPYKGFINPRFTPVTDSEGNILDVTVDYTEGYAEQMLRYSREY